MEEIKTQFLEDLFNWKSVLVMLVGFALSLILDLRTDITAAIKAKFNPSRQTIPVSILMPVTNRLPIILFILLSVGCYVFYIISSTSFLKSSTGLGLVKAGCIGQLLLLSISIVLPLIPTGKTVLMVKAASIIKILNDIFLIATLSLLTLAVCQNFLLTNKYWISPPIKYFSGLEWILLSIFYGAILLLNSKPITVRYNLPFLRYLAIFSLALFIACNCYMSVTKPIRKGNLIEIFFNDDKSMIKNFEELKNHP